MIDLSSHIINCIVYGNEGKTNNFQLDNCISYYKDPYCDGYSLSFCNKVKHLSFKTELNYPVNFNEGTITDFEVMEFIIKYIFQSRLNYDDYSEMSILLIEPYNLAPNDRENISKFFFEEFPFNKVFMIKPSILTLLSEGKYTGIVDELDYDMSGFIPIYDLYTLPHAVIRSKLGRKNINDYMEKLLKEDLWNRDKDKIFEGSGEILVKKACYVSLDYFNELDKVENVSYELPDDKWVFIKEPRIKCPEIIFRPSLYKN